MGGGSLWFTIIILPRVWGNAHCQVVILSNGWVIPVQTDPKYIQVNHTSVHRPIQYIQSGPSRIISTAWICHFLFGNAQTRFMLPGEHTHG
ncbi:hypothetical protein GDO86_017998 [Hymenochirus boettgeri]|uniref:Secreted protein n=1 Tax=Hymenochirus boettgeri TaxID=247094 RepID=A0A8T2IBE3_9PIPI|nr:hypothetical protein GDO86_017998 [Hymenochirus boettgeri]